MVSFRDQRLHNDHQELLRLEEQLNRGRVRLEVRPEGSRPYQTFHLFFHCGGYADDTGAVRQRHQLFLEFPRAYPLEAPPTFKRVSPLLHPNIYPHGVFCLGFEGERKWRPSISLESLVLHVSRLIRFDPDWVNLSPPANRTAEFWGEFMRKFPVPVDDEPFVLGVTPGITPAGQRETPSERPASPRARPVIHIEPGLGRGQRSISNFPAPGTRRSLGPIRITRKNPAG